MLTMLQVIQAKPRSLNKRNFFWQNFVFFVQIQLYELFLNKI